MSDASQRGGRRTAHPAIRVSDLRKTFGEGEDAVTAVDGVSFEIESGSIVGLLGPNGAGKTTTIKSMLGLVVPDAGTVEVSGIDVREKPDEVYGRIGAILEGARNIYWRLTVRENLAFFAGLGGEDPSTVENRHERLLDLIDLTEKADTPVNNLSRGMKQKASLVSTLARDVDVVFMDEPTLGLDVEASIELRSELQRLADYEDVTIVLTSHDMDVIEAVCDRVLILQNGSIRVDDEVDALLDLFNTTQYRVTVDAPLDDGLRREIAESFDAEFEADDEVVRVEVTVTDADVVYDLLDRLRSAGRSIRDLQSSEPDLEHAFLQVVGENDPTSGGEVASATSRTASGERGEWP